MGRTLTAALLLLGLTEAGAAPWQSLAPGLDLGRFEASRPSSIGDSEITVLRIDPEAWDLRWYGVGPDDPSGGKTASRWSRDLGLVAVINAGMFLPDHRTHVGYLRDRERVNNDRVNHYRSVAAFDPRREGLPRFRIFDLDLPGFGIDEIGRDYHALVQNLRLIKRPGENRWSRQDRRWSEAALGEDEMGRVLFIFCRSPYSMHDLNRELLGLGIGLVAAQHLEGGPEAQIFLQVGDFELELWGSYETAFMESDANAAPWPIPNVLGVRPRLIQEETQRR